jgi:glycogen debranching enzyme
MRPTMVSATADLARLRAPGRGVFGSGGVLFSDAVFGRDSVAAAESLLYVYPRVSREVILTLASLQGVVEAPIGPHSNEEEPGKMHHEYRSLFVGSRRISPSSEKVLRELAGRWGGDETSVTYYGCVDTTPLYARLVAKYCAAYGDSILAETVIHRDGRTVTIQDSLIAAMDWMTRRMDSSELGLIEFHRRNPNGIPFQVWKDSGTSYIHSDGTLANWDAPIAATEVQAYAYDALLGSAELLGRRDWSERAVALRRRILDLLWMPAQEFFAMGIDRDAAGRPRLIESIASNGALVLGTGLLDGLSDASDYLAGVAHRICGSDFVTEAGIRCRSVSEQTLVGFQDYHGSWAVWPKETFEVARGLERQGLHRLARQLDNRLLNAVNVAGANIEFLYVHPDGSVMYDFQERDLRIDEPRWILGTNRPESPQAWTVAAALALKRRFGTGLGLQGRLSPPREKWREALEVEVLSGLASVDAFRTADEVEAAYAGRGDFALNIPMAQERDRRARETRHGGEPMTVQ